MRTQKSLANSLESYQGLATYWCFEYLKLQNRVAVPHLWCLCLVQWDSWFLVLSRSAAITSYSLVSAFSQTFSVVFFLFLEHNTSWQWALFCHSCNILIEAFSPQDILIFWGLFASPFWTFAFVPTMHCCAGSGVCKYILKTGYPFETMFPC